MQAHRKFAPQATVRSAALALLAALMSVTQPVSAQDPGKTEGPRGPVQQPSLKQAPAPQMRSAQGDCVREANRRGYTVTDTGNFQQSRDGWSIDLRARDRRGRTTDGKCFVFTQTGEVSLYGFGWGDDWNGNDTLEFVCASTGSAYRECQLPIDGRVRLVEKLSDARCTEGTSWGQRGDRVWVDKGCRARFEVTRSGQGGGANGLIQCQSENQRYRECPLGPGFRDARLVRELSSRGRCQRDSTWGTRGSVIWVTNGCRAEFERIRGNGNGYGNGNGDRDRDGDGNGKGNSNGALSSSAVFTRSACLSEARRMNLEVSALSDPLPVPGGFRMDLQVRTGNGGTRNATCTVSSSTARASIQVQ